MARTIRFLPVAIFLAFAAMPVALFDVTGPWPGPITPEFRPLRPFPRNIGSNTFHLIGDWFSDRIGLRWPLLYLGVEITDRVWQPRVRGSVILGDDPWLFWTDDETEHTARLADVRGRLRIPEKSAKTIDSMLRAVRESYAACGKRAFVTIAPNKQSIYPEKLESRRAEYHPSRFDGLLEMLSPEARAIMIDPRPAIRGAKDIYPAPVYFRMDTHWNRFGAYQAYRAIVAALARENAIYRPELSAFDQFDVAIDPFNSADIMMRVLYRTSWQFDQLVTFRAKTAPPFPDQIQESDYLHFVNPEGRGRLVIHGDSFSPRLAEFLSRHFGDVILLQSTDSLLAFDGAFDARSKADVVLLEIVERFLPNLAKGSLNIDKACAD